MKTFQWFKKESFIKTICKKFISIEITSIWIEISIILIFYQQALFSQETFISIELGSELEDTQMKKTEFSLQDAFVFRAAASHIHAKTSKPLQYFC